MMLHFQYAFLWDRRFLWGSQTAQAHSARARGTTRTCTPRSARSRSCSRCARSTRSTARAARASCSVRLRLASRNAEKGRIDLLDRQNEDGSCAGDAWGECKKLFRFLSGEPVPSTRAPPPSAPEPREEKQESGWRAGLTGLFAGLKGAGRDAAQAADDAPDGQVHTDGEVHADLIMVRYVRVLQVGSVR